MSNKTSKNGKKGVILGGILVGLVIVLGISIFVVNSILSQSLYSQEEIRKDLAELAEKQKGNRQDVYTGMEDIDQFIKDYEAISGHELDYEKEGSSIGITLYDSICGMEVTNYNTQTNGKFIVKINFSGGDRDEYYKSSIQTILQVFGMKEEDIHTLTDGFVSDDANHYTFDNLFVSQNYHDSIRADFTSSQKKVNTTKKTNGWIEITAYNYPSKEE